MKHTKTIAIATTAAIALTASTAGAASLVTSKSILDGSILNRDIHKNTISENRLDRGVRAKLNRAGNAGQNGTNGSNGSTGTTGPRGATGATGATGAAGQNGQNGADGFNVAKVVAKSGDQGWTLTGTPAARLAGGELKLAGGFDNSTVAGGIGVTKSYDAPLSTLDALSYSLHVNRRVAPDTSSAPTIHVAVTGAATGTASGFMNLVYEPVNNGGTQQNVSYTFDATEGQWWGTRDTPGHPRQATDSLASFVAANPGAKIIAISLDNGGSSANTVAVGDFSAGTDNLVVGFGGSFTRYDFGG